MHLQVCLWLLSMFTIYKSTFNVTLLVSETLPEGTILKTKTKNVAVFVLVFQHQKVQDIKIAR
jgi:hypothetical protein